MPETAFDRSPGLSSTRLRYEDLDAHERAYLRRHYLDNIHPLLTPQVTDPAHPFPFISDRSINLLVTVRYSVGRDTSVARIKIPAGAGVPRLVEVPGRDGYVRLEDVITDNLDRLLPGMEVVRTTYFRITRGAFDTRVGGELDPSRFGPIVKLEVEAGIDPKDHRLLATELGLDAGVDVREVRGAMAWGDA